jgi:hypothetical protein
MSAGEPDLGGDLALQARARSLYPDDAYLQQQWLRGVRLVRTTARGWLLEPPALPPARSVLVTPRTGPATSGPR